MVAKVLERKVFFNRFSIISLIEGGLRAWVAYILISNSGVGIVMPLEELGMPDGIYNIIKGMWDTGFMMHLVKLTEFVAGLCLLFNIFVPLALVALFPVLVNIYGIHIFLFDSFFTNGLFMLLVCALLAYRHRTVYKPLFKIKQP